MMDIDREIGRALDALADSDDSTRVGCLLDVADLYRQSAAQGAGEFPDADRLVADVYTLIADADLVATGQLSRRHATGTALEPLLGPILNQMAQTPVLRERAVMVVDLAVMLDNEVAAESVAYMPYGGLVGGRDEVYLAASFPKMVRNVYRRWRETRAA